MSLRQHLQVEFSSFYPRFGWRHCIGVDPYYLLKLNKNYYPEIVLAGRRINDSMASWFADQLILNMSKKI